MMRESILMTLFTVVVIGTSLDCFADVARYGLHDSAPIGILQGQPLRIDDSTLLYRSGNGRLVFMNEGFPNRYKTIWTQTCGDVSTLCRTEVGIIVGDSEGRIQILNEIGDVINIQDLGLGAITCMTTFGNMIMIGTDSGFVCKYDPLTENAVVVLAYARPIVAIDIHQGVLTTVATPCAILESSNEGSEWREVVNDSLIPISAVKRFNDSTFMIGSVMSSVYTYTVGSDSMVFRYRFKYYPPKWDTKTDYIDQIAVNGERVFVTGHILMMTFEYEYVYFSDDGGNVWRQSAFPQEPAGTSNLICNVPRSLSFNDKGDGTLVLHDFNIDANLICTTTDNGVTWQGDTVLIGRLYDSIQFRDVPWPIQRSFREVHRSNNALFAIALRSITNAGTFESVNYETGVYCSQDEGRTWLLRGSIPEVATRFSISGDTMLIGADSGAVYTSIDAGFSFYHSMTIDTPDYANRVTICGRLDAGAFVAHTTVGGIHKISNNVSEKVVLSEVANDSAEVGEPCVRDSFICYPVNNTDQNGRYSESVVVHQLLGAIEYQVVDITSHLPGQLKIAPRVLSGKGSRYLISIASSIIEVDFSTGQSRNLDTMEDGSKQTRYGTNLDCVMTESYDVVLKRDGVLYARAGSGIWTAARKCGSTDQSQHSYRSLFMLSEDEILISVDDGNQLLRLPRTTSVATIDQNLSASSTMPSIVSGGEFVVPCIDPDLVTVYDLQGNRVQVAIASNGNQVSVQTGSLVLGQYVVTWSEIGRMRSTLLLVTQ